MDSVTEVVSFFLKSADVSESLLQVLNNTLLQQPGCLRVRWSLLYEDATKARCFIDWDDISRHEQFKASPSYRPFLDKLDPFIESAPQLHHVKFHPITSSVLDNKGGKGNTPVAEVLYIYFQGDDSFTPEMKDRATISAEQFLAKSVPGAKGYTGETAMGWAIEMIDFKGELCRALAILIGWGSVEAHQQYRATEGFGKSISILQGSAGIKGVSVVHVSLTTAERRD
jgi:quinol monooxygenase YgiN